MTPTDKLAVFEQFYQEVVRLDKEVKQHYTFSFAVRGLISGVREQLDVLPKGDGEQKTDISGVLNYVQDERPVA